MKCRLRSLLLCLFAILPAPLHAQSAHSTCNASGPCEVEGGFYHARMPAGWDGRPTLPVVVFYHGWQDEAKSVIADPALQEFADRRDVILIVPQGAGKTWSYPGSPGQHRDEFAFTSAVLADVKLRFPVDASQVFASGFSQGGSMVWNLACHRPEGFTGFIPVAGGFWEPLPESCQSGPRRIFHVHGTADRTVPMAGRSLRNGTYRQGDIRKGWDMLKQALSCTGPPIAVARETRFACEHMKGCPSPAAMEMCLHPGGHDMDPTFLDAALDWFAAEGDVSSR